jgi:hypothetical protein
VANLVQERGLMSLRNWFSAKNVNEFADSLVAELRKRYPPDGIDARADKVATRWRKTHDTLFGRAAAFARAENLNVYLRARLGNRVKWALREAGYTPHFVDTFVHELVAVITVARRPVVKRPP